MDCSAYVSWVWSVSRYTTDSIWNVSYPITKDALRAGDALNLTIGRDPARKGHIRIFEAWANAEHSAMWVFEETPPRVVHRVIAYDERYQPIRLAGLSDAGDVRLIPGTPPPSVRPTPVPTRRPVISPTRTLVWVRGRGIVIAEPSVVAKDARTGAPLAIGAEAKRMVGRTPASIIAIRPLKDGVISDFDMTELMLTHYIRKVHDRALLVPRPRVVVGIPSGVTEVEKRAVQEAAMSAGARWCRLVEEPMAAAIGAGLPVNEPTGSMIVDIGGGTT